MNETKGFREILFPKKSFEKRNFLLNLTNNLVLFSLRVQLDMLSVQGKTGPKWEDKIDKAFWRGRDSRQERLDLIDLARQNSDLINASLTNFFFFRDKEDQYGPKVPHISFFEFFNVRKK